LIGQARKRSPHRPRARNCAGKVSPVAIFRATARWLAIAFFIEIKITRRASAPPGFLGFSGPRSSFVL
jgi:hypothetical protein